MAEMFDSLNPYESIAYIRGKDPKDLCDSLKRLKKPIKILAIVPWGMGHVAYIMGDVVQSVERKPLDIKTKDTVTEKVNKKSKEI